MSLDCSVIWLQRRTLFSFFNSRYFISAATEMSGDEIAVVQEKIKYNLFVKI
jgi:hypothetical protein